MFLFLLGSNDGKWRATIGGKIHLNIKNIFNHNYEFLHKNETKWRRTNTDFHKKTGEENKS